MKKQYTQHTELTPLGFFLALIMLLIPFVNLFFWIPIVFLRRPCDRPSEF